MVLVVLVQVGEGGVAASASVALLRRSVEMST
jgi:hypothetical protein